jgi:hypothetical protein
MTGVDDRGRAVMGAKRFAIGAAEIPTRRPKIKTRTSQLFFRSRVDIFFLTTLPILKTLISLLDERLPRIKHCRNTRYVFSVAVVNIYLYLQETAGRDTK